MITTKDARFNLTSEKIFNSWEDKMLMGGEYDLNSSQIYTDCRREVLKQTMLNQEVIFRNQVHELHRLYTTQKTLMKDFGWREFNGYNLGKASAQSALGHCANHIRCEPLAVEKTFSTVPMVGLTQSVNNDCLLEGRGICSRLQQRPLDLQLPSTHYINYIGGDLLKKGNKWDSPEKTVELKHYFCSDDICFPEEVKLSLSIEGDNRKKGVGRGTWNDKNNYFSSQHIIDLEESTETVSSEDAKPVFSPVCAAPMISGDKHDSQVPAQSSRTFIESLTKDPSQGITVTAFVDVSEFCHERNPIHQGLNECHGDLPCNNVVTKGKLFSSCEAAHLDLNKVLLDESSFHSNDPVVAYPSTGSSSGAFDGLISKFGGGVSSTATSWREPNSNHFNETSALLRQEALNPALMDSNSNNNKNITVMSATSKAASGSKVCTIDLESMSWPPSDLGEKSGNHSGNSESENIDLPLNFHNRNHVGRGMPALNSEEKEDIGFSHPYRNQDVLEDTHSSRSPALCKFDCSADDNSCSIKTMQSGSDLGESNVSPFNMFKNFESSRVAETACQQDLRSSDNSKEKHQCCDKKGESAEVDVLIQKAAISLIFLSLESPISNQDCITKAGSNEIGNEEREQPQYSSDSYESMVIKLTESSADEYCVSSKPFEVNEMDKKDSGIKLRRGRRLKDFQKDILPGLASLSRHEICEDINIIEGVIRSREYKKLRSKTANGEDWFKPVRSRRSRLNYVGRRYYS